ncbi:unnamed protein product [Bursaphelenchus okinawaensis]|uniref:U3 small nucleolar RNA-associated protein 25 homolog n=1 Tax=Bursaphelenchus okinawaensis TaxID=465554 RepID=A0A811LNW0_9BILA|nr:unnamed protein product [Bursaphelenchus okinawaensis]CAG9126443.1 unnamed protein product [Bursaphelenchus okinawaensis]
MSKRKSELLNESGETKKRHFGSTDYFTKRYQTNIPDSLIARINDGTTSTRNLSVNSFPEASTQLLINTSSDLAIDKKEISLIPNIEFVHKRLLADNKLNNEDQKLFGIFGRYLDVCYARPQGKYTDAYCYHILNHLLRSKNQIILNQQRIEAAKNQLTDDLIEECRDQGLTRPKVLILAPFKKHAYDIVKTMTRILLKDDKNHILNLAKFEDEYGPTETGMHDKWRAPEDFKELLSGNIDDSFRIGLSLGKKAIKLYTAFDNSDIILCSPLGLRMIVGDEEEDKEKREIDFLSSIELVVLERADVMYMQNWEHLLTVMGALNQMPKEIQTDISRVRHWVLKGHGRYYRQLMAFSAINFAELHALFVGKCNFFGQANIIQKASTLIDNIQVPLLQELHRFDCDDQSQQSDFRFAYFVRNILPKLKQGTLVFIPSYFDYVRVRNYLKKDEESFAQIHEYASDGKIRKSRKAFANGEKKIMLITERCQFFRHFFVKGVKAVIFYQLPIVPRLYYDTINMTKGDGTLSTSLIFSKSDVLRLQNVFGMQQAKELILSQKKFHALVSE